MEFLDKVCSFAEELLKEVLEQRCNPKRDFYLPGLPVTDGELLSSLSEDRMLPKASESLHRKWEEIMEEAEFLGIGQNSPRLLQLFYLYNLNEVWRLALLLSFVYKWEPKYEKAFQIYSAVAYCNYRTFILYRFFPLDKQYQGLERGSWQQVRQ